MAAIYYLRRKRIQDLNRTFDFSKMIETNTNYLLLSKPQSLPTEIKRSLITITSVLGKGAFGEVSKATYTDISGKLQLHVAVKILHRTPGLEFQAARDSLLSEASIMAQFDHDHVVRLIGVVTAGEPLLVVIEYCENGALNSFLEKNNCHLNVLLKIAIDCANGMT